MPLYGLSGNVGLATVGSSFNLALDGRDWSEIREGAILTTASAGIGYYAGNLFGTVVRPYTRSIMPSTTLSVKTIDNVSTVLGNTFGSATSEAFSRYSDSYVKTRNNDEK